MLLLGPRFFSFWVVFLLLGDPEKIREKNDPKSKKTYIYDFMSFAVFLLLRLFFPPFGQLFLLPEKIREFFLLLLGRFFPLWVVFVSALGGPGENPVKNPAIFSRVPGENPAKIRKWAIKTSGDPPPKKTNYSSDFAISGDNPVAKIDGQWKNNFTKMMICSYCLRKCQRNCFVTEFLMNGKKHKSSL